MQGKRISRSIERQYNDFLRRHRVANGTATEDDLRDWLGSVSGNWVPPTSKTVIFGDLKDFEYLSPAKHVDFHRLLERIYAWSAGMAGGRPLFGSSWGDAIHAVYDTPSQAAAFSMAFVEVAAAESINWRFFGLPANTNFRFAIHNGPVQKHKDKILGRNLYVGQCLTFAARLEPAANPGQVLTTATFARLLNASGDPRFECKDVGKRYLLKTKALCPAFELVRKPCTV